MPFIPLLATNWLQTIGNQWSDSKNALTDLGIIATIIAIPAGFIICWYFWHKPPKASKPTWFMETTTLIRNRTALDDLDVRFKDRSVDNLSVSTIRLFNAGRKNINKGDVSGNFSVVPKDEAKTQILDAKPLGFNEDGSDFTAHWEAKDQRLVIDFTYLAYQQGGIVHVVHTGTSNDALLVKGKLKTQETAVRVYRLLIRRQWLSNAIFLGAVVLPPPIVAFLTGTTTGLDEQGKKQTTGFLGWLFAYSFLWVIVLVFAFLIGLMITAGDGKWPPPPAGIYRRLTRKLTTWVVPENLHTVKRLPFPPESAKPPKATPDSADAVEQP